MVNAPTGQAWYVLRGYRYQLLQSLDSWLGLDKDEILLLETEEDFSVEGPKSSVDAQVKSSAAASGPRSHSLRSQDVRAALTRFWVRSGEGLDQRQQLAFIAQGGVAKEQGLTFPNDVSGIDYWRAAVLGADTAPIRLALASIFNGEPIGIWISSGPSDEDLRSRLLMRVRWMLDALDDRSLIELIRDKIAELYLQKGLWVTLADEAVHSLLGRVFEAATQAAAKDRRLSAVDLHRSIEVAAGPALALQNVAQAVVSPSEDAPEGLLIAMVGFPASNVTDRRETVSTILEQTRGQPTIWLYGGSGVGKSTLARLVAVHAGGQWMALDLRSIQDDSRAVLTTWRELLRAIQRTPGLCGIIIDDLAGAAFDILRPRLAALVASTAPKGVRIIVTSSQKPSLARLAELAALPNAAIQAPYLSEADVRALVTGPSGPISETIEGWTQLLIVTTNGGHPLLVAAKVASLRFRGWPMSALKEDLGPLQSEAIRATREEARRRLLDEIPSPEARALLRRLGAVFDRSDDALLIKLAHQPPQIANASDALAILRGSWIELLPGNDLRLSPLISDISQDLDPEESKNLRRIAAEYWLGTGLLDQRTLPLCFWNAFWGKHTTILLHVCQAIETLPNEHLLGAVALLSPMTFFRTDQSIYPEVPPVGAMLRLLQFEVANAMQDGEVAARSADALLSEIDDISHEELRLLSASISIPKVLLAEYANVSPTTQLNWALRLRVVVQRLLALNIRELASAHHSLHAGFPSGTDLSGFLFTVIVTRIRSSARMLAMIEALDLLGETDRNNFLDATATTLRIGAGAFVHNGWAQEQLDSLDLQPALERFTQMSVIVQRWQRSDIYAEIENARSVILDEGLNDQRAALTVTDRAIGALGNMPSLIRQKAKVLGHLGDDVAAVRLLTSVEDTVGIDSPLDRALALRDGAISAARVKFFSDAVRLFGKAHGVLLAEGQHPALAAGMQVETALTFWEAGEFGSALSQIANALEAIEVFDPSDSRQNERAHQFARAAVGLFWHKLGPYQSESERRIPIGQASSLSGDEPLLGLDLKPLAYNWRVLALCEIEVGIDVGIEARSLNKQVGQGFAAVEMFIAMARFSRTIADSNFAKAFLCAIDALWAYRSAGKFREGDAGLQIYKSPAAALDIFSQEGLLGIVATMPVDILIWHRYRGVWDSTLVSRIRAGCVIAWGDASVIADVLDAAEGGVVLGVPSTAVALAAFLADITDLSGNPRRRFERDLLLVSHAALSLCRRVIEPVVVPIVAEGWSAVLEKEGFALRSPMQHRPAMEAAINEIPKVGLRAAADLLLATAPAVGVPLSQSWEQLLRQISGSQPND